ncbi:MAG TPA: hypothetical protein VHB18_01235 [Mycobacteriales bacterium]|nr:hypothetical protein [Mycobacteriales bacterium]
MRRTATAIMGAALLAGSTIAVASAAPTRPSSMRPAAERVPSSVTHVRILYRDTADPGRNQTLYKQGHRLVVLFNALKREPKNYVHCDAVSTARTEVVFRGHGHKWVATEALCTDVQVTRDGKPLPTLIPSRAWDKALTRRLGHSPTGTGGSTPTP